MREIPNKKKKIKKARRIFPNFVDCSKIKTQNQEMKKKKEFCAMNFVPRTLLRRARENNVGGNEEIKNMKEKKK